MANINKGRRARKNQILGVTAHFIEQKVLDLKNLDILDETVNVSALATKLAEASVRDPKEKFKKFMSIMRPYGASKKQTLHLLTAAERRVVAPGKRGRPSKGEAATV